MPKIGDYRDLVERYPRTLASADTQGEEVESWAAATPAQKHWGLIERPSGSESTTPPRASGDTMQLRFRHVVTLEAVDHVYLTELGAEYAVTGVWKERAECGGFQTVCSLAGPV